MRSGPYKGIGNKRFSSLSGNAHFDLDANLIVLFGPNGFGKTSMFDAIDFACTGGVTRFDEYLGNTSEKQLKVLPHLNSSPDRSSVKLTATIIGEDMIFERTVSSRKEAKIDSKTNIDRTKTLMAL
ncbi:MAG: AAA family ATPase, partial [bacterium]|nr:AAA family ATPase [bacterium]